MRRTGIGTLPRTTLDLADVARSLGIDSRAVERLAQAGQLPARQLNGRWQFRAGDVANWAAINLHVLPGSQVRSPPRGSDLLVGLALRPDTVAVPLAARTRVSVLSELVQLADRTGRITDWRELLNSLVEREKQHSTALPGGVAIPHSAQVGRYLAEEWPLIIAGRTSTGVPFGEATGGLTDLYFLLCCADYRQHLVYLGRLSRLLSEPGVPAGLRAAEDAEAFVELLRQREEALCGTG